MVHGTAEESWSDMPSSTINKTVKVEKKTLSSSKNSVRENKGAGSRRIFSPVFKLQVLDSYRQDADCQGNQRATARKYGIHRRQIQKWLQMETNLRLSVQQSNATALNLTSARQPDGNKECNAGSISVAEVKKVSLCADSSNNNITLSSSSSSNDVVKLLIKEESKFINNNNEICGNNSDSEEYVNVDEITDSEDDDTSSCSSYEKNDKALDFTCATLSKRRFYTTDFKLHVLDAFKNDKTCQGNQRATARKFGIHRRQVQKWLNQENLIKSEQALNNTCLDLSQNNKKRKLDQLELPSNDRYESTKKKTISRTDHVVQESALCLVKNKNHDAETNNNTSTSVYHHVQVHHPSSIEHSFSNSSLNYVSPEYPLCLYQPWNCCYQQISSSGFVPPSKYSYSYTFDFKVANYETSYVDIPVQYGFGDSVPSKWLKENPLYVHEPPSIQVLSSSSYR